MTNTQNQNTDAKNSGNALRKRISTVVKTSATLQKTLHELLVDCLRHAEQFDDARPLNELITLLPQGQRIEAMKVWAEAFSPVRWNGQGEVGILAKKAKTYTPFNVDAAALNPYFSFTKEKKPTMLTLEALRNIITGLEKRIDKAEAEGRIAEGENVVDLRKFVNKVTKAAA